VNFNVSLIDQIGSKYLGITLSLLLLTISEIMIQIVNTPFKKRAFFVKKKAIIIIYIAKNTAKSIRGMIYFGVIRRK